MTDGIAMELETINMGDVRLNQRAAGLLEVLTADPQASINSACGGWAETLAAYRFFDNPNVEPQQILHAHSDAVHQRIERQSVILVVEDTTELDFTPHPANDSGLLNTEKRFGFYDHVQLAFTPEKLCLGVLDVELFDRSEDELGRSGERKHDPIESKESFRWLRGYRRCCELAQQYPDKQIINVADREADIYDIFVEAARAEEDADRTAADYVIRAAKDRRTTTTEIGWTDAGNPIYESVADQVASSDVMLIRDVELPQTPQRSARTARLEVRAATVTMRPPKTRRTGRDALPDVTTNMVLIDEVNGPGDGTDISWFLITSLPIGSAKKVARVMETYVARWPIEVYFRVLKTGCRVEEIQLETTARQRRCLMFYHIIAWRLMYVTFLGRECPDLPCDLVFQTAEWMSVWRIVTGEPPPEEAPSLRDFIPVLAGLGGYNNRRHDAPPGPQAIWTGIRRMTDFALAWQTFGPGAN